MVTQLPGVKSETKNLKEAKNMEHINLITKRTNEHLQGISPQFEKKVITATIKIDIM